MLRFAISRPGTTATIAGLPALPDSAFHGEINFLPGAATSGASVMITAEVPLLESEVNPFVNAVVAGGLSPGAIHNHYLLESPRIIFVHVEGAGDATTVAQAIKAAIGQTGDTIAAPPSGGNPSGLDVTAINGVLGGAAEVGNGVVSIDVDRADSFTMFGVPVPQSMGAESTIMFQPAPSGGAAVAFEVAVLPSELDAVTKVLRSGGITFTALHNHSVGMQPPLFFLHGSAVGDPVATARIIRSALNQTNSAGSPRVQFGAAQ